MKLFVKTFQGQILEIQVEDPHTTTIKMLKENIEGRLGLSPTSQRLVFSCKELVNDMSVFDAGVTPNATLFLVLALRGVQHVVIKTLSDKEFTLEMNTESTVLEIKQRVCDKIAIPLERQRLIANGRELLDGEKLCQHFADSSKPAVLHLLSRLHNTKGGYNGSSILISPTESLSEMQEEFYSPSTVLGSPLIETAFGMTGPSLSRTSSFQRQLRQMETEDDGVFGPMLRSKSAELTDLDVFHVERETSRDFMDIEPEINVGMFSKSAGFVFSPRADAAASIAVKQEPDDIENVWSNALPRATVAAQQQLQDTKPVPVHSLSPQQLVQMQKYQKDILEASAAAAASASSINSIMKQGFKSTVVIPPTASSSGPRRVKQELTPEERLQKRLLKNRLSAERSRQRKQAYVEELEFKLSVSKSENSHLRDRVRELECSLAALSLLVQPAMLEPYPILSSSLQSLPISSAAH